MLGAKHCATREATSVPTGMPTGFLNGRRYLTSSDFRTYGRSSLKIAKCRGARRRNTKAILDGLVERTGTDDMSAVRELACILCLPT